MKRDTIAIPKELLADLDAAIPKERWTPVVDAVILRYYGKIPRRRITEILKKHTGTSYGHTTIGERFAKLTGEGQP